MRKKIALLVIVIIVFMTVNIFAIEVKDDIEELDYIWIEEEIENAKKNIDWQIQSRYAVVLDRESKTVLYGKEENKEVPMASTTKIMTAVIALESINNLEETCIVCKKAAAIGGSRLGLKTDDKITYNDLLYGLMLSSGNDAALQIAISISENIENFAKLMNNKAKSLGLEHTNFVTPHGLDDSNHYTTALELAKITDYALNIDKFREIVSTKKYTITINGYNKTIQNTNELLGHLDGVNGVKTGFTNEAGRCLVTSISRNNFDIIVIVLGADTKKMRTRDSIKLIESTYSNYELINIEELIKNEIEEWKKINEKRIKIVKGNQNKIETMLGKIKYRKYPVLKEDKGNINFRINVKKVFEAPIKENTKVGTLKVLINTTEIENIDILNKKNIERKKPINYFQELFSIYFTAFHI